MAEVEEAQVLSVVFDGDQVLEVLVSKVFQHQRDVV
jgi:hypothetical protein